MNTCGGMDVKIHVFLITVLIGGESSASRSGRFTPWERASSIHQIGGWVGPRTDLDDVERRKILPLPELKLQLLSH
jgi:hypothetical protein